MRIAHILLLSSLVMLSACSANNRSQALRSEDMGPVGTFVGPVNNPVMKVHLEPGGFYIVEDVGPPEYWTMMEGMKAYVQRIQFPAQRGRWSMDNRTGRLTLEPETSASFRWSTAGMRYDKGDPDRLAWGDHAFLSRVDE